MTDEELKKKISEIIQKARNDYSEMTIYDYIADVLIAAGIGDVSSEKAMRELVEAFYREKCAEYDLLNYQMQKSEYRVVEAEHRAEVAERALEILNDYECLSNPIRYYMKQAEKELQEEK